MLNNHQRQLAYNIGIIILWSYVALYYIRTRDKKQETHSKNYSLEEKLLSLKEKKGFGQLKDFQSVRS